MIALNSICTYIYGLVDPHSFEVFYVGRSSDPKDRFNSHIYHARGQRKQYASGQYIQHLFRCGEIPQLVILDKIITERNNGKNGVWQSTNLEKHWIKDMQSKGFAWCNNTSVLSRNPILYEYQEST